MSDEFEVIDRNLELLACDALLDLRAPEFCGNARLGPPAQPAALFWIAVARSIDGQQQESYPIRSPRQREQSM